MTARPGNDGGECPRCGETTTQIGWESAVIGTHCENCKLTLALTGDAMTASEAREQDWDDWEPLGTS